MTDEQIESLTGVGATLRDFGGCLEGEWLARNGKLLNADERKENDGRPNAVANPTVDVEIPNVMFVPFNHVMRTIRREGMVMLTMSGCRIKSRLVMFRPHW